MPDFRCYCRQRTLQNCSPIELSTEESVHLVAANRARKGDPVVAFNGQGIEWDCILAEANKRKAVLTPTTCRVLQRPPISIALAQSIPKGKTLDSIIRRATELGATAIYPIVAERAAFKLKLDKRDTKESKWINAAIEGAKQSGNPFLPEIDEPLSPKDLISRIADQYDLKLIACLREGSGSIKAAIVNHGTAPQSAIILVGPEGDFTTEEEDRALDAGFLPVTLGPYVLRCETAAVSSLGILRNQLS